MQEWLTRLRERPESERKFFALSVAGGITAAIFIVWLYSFTAASPAPSPDAAQGEQRQTQAEESAALQYIDRMARRIAEGIGGLLPSMPSFFEERIEFQRRGTGQGQ